MNTRTMPGRRWATTGMLAVLGAVVALATWVGGEHSLSLMLGGFYALCCGGSYLWLRGSGDVAAIIRLTGDERQRLLDTRATAAAGLVTLGFCAGGMVVDLARGGTGNPWVLILAVGGVAYIASLVILIRRG